MSDRVRSPAFQSGPQFPRPPTSWTNSDSGENDHATPSGLTGTLGMTGADAKELLKAARTAQAEAGPGALADYPVPGGGAHLLIHYAPGSRAYRFKLTTPDNEAVVRVFAYQADPGRPAEEIAAEAFDIFNDHPRDPDGADLACAYYGRRLPSLSFPGNSACCSRSCCVHCRAVWPDRR